MSEGSLIGLVLVGSEGRMGRAIDLAVTAQSDCRVVGRVDLGASTLPSVADRTVIVDFSSDEGTQEAIIVAESLRTPILVGTTGLSSTTIGTLERVSESIPVALVSNTSLGVVLLEHLARIVCKTLGGDSSWSLEMVETHHHGKRDAPSGTSISLAEVCSKSGIEMPREQIQSIRRDDVIGEHELRFTSDQEHLILRHEAKSRALFAQGALSLARRLLERAPGLYRAADLLEFKTP